ncbi:MAG: VCBS repeat-containing protein [Lewinellaceae bacterium]|nr:VCBS repeat-containing protein [Lewinellaceae bacterium]
MTRIYAFLSFALILSTVSPSTGQVSFSNGNSLLSNSSFHSGVAIAVVDMNGDGLDDIARLSQGRELQIEYQQPGGALFVNYTFGNLSGQSQWSMCVADVDNNGYNDVLAGGRYDDVKLVRAMDDGSGYEMSTLPGAGLFVQGSNLADINNDGWIDYFACHDDGESRIWANDSTGFFVSADEWIDMATVPASDNSGNYGSIWTDFDLDGDLDLYIAKCRQGVNNPSDPRRINALYLNIGGNNFVEAADSFNLKIGAQSWTADFQDIDNDGDYDCFVTNHDVPSMLLENDGAGHFTDITDGSGLNISGLPIQGVMRDFDNDGFVDILVAGTRQHLFLNNGDKTFTEVQDAFNSNQMESFAIGDLNHDGFLDVYGGYAQVYTTPSTIDDVIWLNDAGNGNNFIAVSLVGKDCNRNGIGARIEAYGPWGIQAREVRAGESYGIMNSMTQHFGLGAYEMVDSLVIRWPNGHIDTLQNLAANQFITVIENSCTSPEAYIDYEGSTVMCEGDTLMLSAPEGFTYIWSTGDTTRAIPATGAGTYNVTVYDGSECFGVSPSVIITVNPDATPSVTALGDTRFCQGGSVFLLASEADSYAWSNGETSSLIEVMESGDYTVSTPGLCQEFTSGPVTVSVLESAVPEVEYAAYLNGQAEISVIGDYVVWYDRPDGVDPIASGNLLATPVETDTVFYAENHTIYPGELFLTGMPSHEGGNYSGNQYNGAVIFDCLSPFTLQEVLVYTDTEGPRIIELQDADGNVLASRQIDISTGLQVITLNFQIEPGTGLALTTNTAHNQAQFGFNSPRLRRSDQNVNYPYVVEDVVEIKNSNLGEDRYYYFFNWKIQKPTLECLSDRVAIPVTVVGTEEAVPGSAGLTVLPNPVSARLDVQLPELTQETAALKACDATGRVVEERSIRRGDAHVQINMEGLPAGLYFLQLMDGGVQYAAKVVKR